MSISREVIKKVSGWVSDEAYKFWCWGCCVEHIVYVKPSKSLRKVSLWTFNGSSSHPTFNPSVKYPKSGRTICHFWIKNGKLIYLTDSTHKFSGKTVDMGWPQKP